MQDNTYLGWTNIETWSANLWLDQEYWIDQAKESESVHTLAEQMKEYFCEEMDMITHEHGMFADLLQYAFDSINWHEISEHVFEDINDEE